MSVLFKTPRIRDEFAKLTKENMALFELIVALADHVQDTYKQELTLTSILRTPEEQAALYANSPKKVIHSDHMTWEAVDIRSLVFKRDEIDELVKYINTRWKNKDGRVVALYHTVVGGAPHFHIALRRQ